MPRGIIDIEGMNSEELRPLKTKRTPHGLPFNIAKIGHLVLKVSDIERSVDFYTQVLGFKISDVYPETMMPGRMVFMHCNHDHHGLGLVGGNEEGFEHKDLHHVAFEVATIDEVFRAREHLKAHGVPIDFEGRRRAGSQVSVEFRDPDDHSIEIFWGVDQVGFDGHIRPPEEWREEHTLEDAVDNPPVGQDTTLQDKSLRKR